MKKKLLAMFLSVVMLFTLTAPAFAASLPQENTDIDFLASFIDVHSSESDAYAAAKNVYLNLSPEQQQEFLALIESLAYQGDTQLVEFHKTYVDPFYEFAPDGIMPQAAAVAAAADVATQLQALNLPSAVYYGLLAFATALGVPVGNVVDVVVGLGLGVIIVANWDAISGVWNQIVDIFVNAFGSVVMDAFNYIAALVKGVTLVKEDEPLPNQGPVSDDDHLDQPPVDAGSQGKHVPGHNNEQQNKSKWPKGKNGVKETQEAWKNGVPVKSTEGEEVRTYDFGKPIGPKGETRVKVHLNRGTGRIHGYPVP